MTKYREIIRLAQPILQLSQEKIAASCGVSKKTVNKVLAAAKEKELAWPLPASYTDAVIEGILFPREEESSSPSKLFFASPFCIKLQTKNVGDCRALLQVVAPTFCRLLQRILPVGTEPAVPLQTYG